jgi:hypothetical protein
MAEADVIVWYNPRCSKCRGAEQLLAEYGVPAQKMFYLDNPPPRAEITRVLALLGAADPRGPPSPATANSGSATRALTSSSTP